MIISTLVWLYRSDNDRYRLLRNAMYISGAIGLVVFVLYPVAPLRILGVASPLLMSAAVVLTANHYVIDAVAGSAVALVGLGVAGRIQPTHTVATSPTASDDVLADRRLYGDLVARTTEQEAA